jgi:hypothetical protein
MPKLLVSLPIAMSSSWRENDADSRVLSFRLSVPDTSRTTEERVLLWGCRSDACNFETCNFETRNTTTFQFDTAWTPPCAWVKRVAQRYPAVTFELSFEEPNESFEGELIVHGNMILKEETRPLVISEEDE